MLLDPQVAQVRARRLRDNVPPLYTLSLEQARADDLAAIQAASDEPEKVFDVTDMTINTPGYAMPVRVYRPDDRPGLGAIVYFFGGGWTLGSIETADGVARFLANASRCVVIVPQYRLAPEHRFPAAVHDAYAATRWAYTHADDLGIAGDRIAVGGDSAGGNLAAAVTLLARDAGDLPLRAQLLVYPNTDYASDTPSAREYDESWMFNRHSVGWYWGHYLTDPSDGANPLASPLRAESLRDLPPALVITAEHDPLRDQAEQYGRRLAEEGVAVEARRYDGMVHGFFCMPGDFDAGRRAQRDAGTFLRRRLAGGAPDPTLVYPEPGLSNVVFLRPLVEGLPHIEIGEYTYYQDPYHATEFVRRNVLYPYGPERLIIGRYCCIASNTRFIMSGGNHPMIGVGTYPFSMFAGDWWNATRDIVGKLPSRGDTVVGNNVWFGLDAIIMPGVRVGDGAIIAAGSVVTSDVAPYAIVGGNPARLIRRRFSAEEIDELLEIAWWDWSADEVTRHSMTILAGSVADLRAAADAVRSNRG